MYSWTVLFLVHSLKFKKKQGIHKALQFLGDVFIAHNDEDTAISLFTVALEGFTQMDIHRSRAECMLQLGDISQKHCAFLKAVELWQSARALFEQSSQARQIQCINERLASVSEDVWEQHRANLALLAELNAPTETIKEEEHNHSDTEDLERWDLDEKKELDLIAV
jgi:hypothetical protein